MDEKLLAQAREMFDAAEKWNAYLALCSQKDHIQLVWWRKMQQEVYKRELENGIPGWGIKIWSNWDIKWYLQQGGENSLAIHFWKDAFRVYTNYGALDTNKVTDLMASDCKFEAIKLAFCKESRFCWNDWQTIAIEQHPLSFTFDNCTKEELLNSDSLAWYAGNETESFANQLIAKVRPMQTPEITALFEEINEKCKK